MISREELDEMGAVLGVNAVNVQRDYVFGWLLAGLYGESRLADRLVLKGGNAFRKGYFSATRFSSDLDFAAPDAIDPDQLLSALNEVCRLIQARTGVVFDLERNRQAGGHGIGNDKTVYKYKLYFTDFHGSQSKVTIGLDMDVTEFGRLHRLPQKRRLIHPYSDRQDCDVDIRVVSLEEGLADKLKCLLQRESSFDLFDLVYSIFVNDDIEVDKRAIVKTFLKKTIFEPSPGAALSLLLAVPFDTMRYYWEHKIVCARESLLDFSTAVDRFRGELGSLFSTFRNGDHGALAFFPAELRTPIMKAGVNRILLRITYEGTQRLVEPYALRFKRRKDGVGQEYLYAWDQTGGQSGPGLKSLFNYKIGSVEVTDIAFKPRYDIELRKAGEPGDRTTFSQSVCRPTGVRRSPATPYYRVQCAYCGMTFSRATPSTRLDAHRDRYGNDCYGRGGHRV
ncbi:nucleotidyl transferase AbiEii/AbiGii toxin family protein [Streptomyces sp. NEAU-174]|uniref:nucleotidyl transferase AbiEii/AbiGii toxin family protein n=1 Tax=Streptomyces sp. NEAU-174 TaxID=3458254 RepID=UPI0040441A99